MPREDSTWCICICEARWSYCYDVCACTAAKGTGSLVFIDDMTDDLKKQQDEF